MKNRTTRTKEEESNRGFDENTPHESAGTSKKGHWPPADQTYEGRGDDPDSLLGRKKRIYAHPFGPNIAHHKQPWKEEHLPIKGIPKRDWWERDYKTEGHAHWCLPLMMANSAGYYITSPVHFKVTWDGDLSHSADIEIIDALPHGIVDDHSTCGGFTIQSSMTIRTQNEGDFIWLKQIPNMERPWFYPMEGLMEGWWQEGGATAGIVCLMNRPGTFEMKIGDPLCQVVCIHADDLHADLEWIDEPTEESFLWQKHRARPDYFANKKPDLTYLKGIWWDGTKVPTHYTNWNSNKIIKNGDNIRDGKNSRRSFD